MPYTEEQKFKIQLFRESVRLQDPEVETDPAYRFTDEQLWSILMIVTPVHFPDKGPDDITGAEFYFPLLLAKKEIYYRLATSTAPFYPLKAEGASLEKNVRFDHYLALIKQVELEYKNAMNRMMDLADVDNNDVGVWVDGVVQSYEVSVLSNYYSQRNYRVAERPVVSLSVSGITSSSVNVTWEPKVNFSDLMYTRIFVSSDGPIIDEFADNPYPDSLNATYSTGDVHRTKYRFTNLLPDTEYHIAVILETKYGPRGFDEKTFRTLP